MSSIRRNRINVDQRRALAEKERPQVDTSAPGVSADDQHSDSTGSSGRRNLRKPTDKQHKMLETVAPGARPSRKSTRRSANRTKAATQKTRQTKRNVHAPKARAFRGARKGG